MALHLLALHSKKVLRVFPHSRVFWKKQNNGIAATMPLCIRCTSGGDGDVAGSEFD